MSQTASVENVRRSVFPPPVAPLNVRPTLKRKDTPVNKLWYPDRYPFERPAIQRRVSLPPLQPSFDQVRVVSKPVDANPPILPASFDTHKAHFVRDLEAQKDIVAPIKPRVVPLLGQLPDNWQLGVAIGVAIGIVMQLSQLGVNSSLKAGQADIISKLSG